MEQHQQKKAAALKKSSSLDKYDFSAAPYSDKKEKRVDKTIEEEKGGGGLVYLLQSHKK